MQADFSAPLDSYDKLDKAVSPAALEPLRATVVPVERDALVNAAGLLVALFQQLAPPLAEQHGVTYPGRLAVLMLRHFERVRR
jgi:hypothetical protein